VVALAGSVGGGVRPVLRSKKRLVLAAMDLRLCAGAVVYAERLSR